MDQGETSNSKLKEGWNLAVISGYQENYKKWGKMHFSKFC